jgi:predicted DNA-binding transcriptional regulator AlpA
MKEKPASSKLPDRRLKITHRSKRAEAFERRYISPLELAARWSVSTSAIYHSKGVINGLKVIRLGKSIRFLRSEVEALERNREANKQ